MGRRRFLSMFFAAAGLIVLYCLLQKLSVVIAGIKWVFGIISPIFVGFIIAFVLNLPMRSLENLWDKCELGIKRFFVKKKQKKALKTASGDASVKETPVEVKVGKVSGILRRPVCLLVSIVIIFAILAAVVNLVLPEIGKTVRLLVDGVPDWLEKVKKWCIEYAEEYPVISETISGLDIDWESTAKSLLSLIGTGTLGVVGNTFAGVIGAFGGIVDFVIALIFAIYVLCSKETLARQMKRLFNAFLPDKANGTVLHVAQTSHDIFCAFVTGQCIEAVILGSLCAIGMLIFRFPYAAMIGVLVGVTALIPVVGAFIGAGVGAFLILMVDPFQALMFVIFIVILQQIEGNVIYPKVVGNSVGLPAMWVLASVTVGGGIGGIIGMLFAVPTASVLYTLLREVTAKRLEKKAEQRENGEDEQEAGE
ncbi:MAG: AI-2E family transporter [Lachnospiraceae bacterium]|nr:AI-2E family transporter [Lachnospiraceae bacterium]MBQ8547933.1 AI-2E family transporter [Lachnospiraceae bacterium]